MYRIAVCDDDREFAEELRGYVRNLCAGNGTEVLLKVYTDSDELMDMIGSKKLYDLYILDILMPAYTGMELLDVLKKESAQADVILLTSYTDYAVDACGYKQVFRYIPKGSYKKRLEDALKDFFAKMELEKGRRPYVIHNKQKSVKFYQEDVVYIYKNRKYAVFVMKTGEEERERCSLSAIFEKLHNPDMIMLDRCYIVNILHINRIQANEVLLETGELLHTSRENMQKVKAAFTAYWGDLI